MSPSRLLMECTSCHDPHENGLRPFLSVDPRKLCLSCHSHYAEFGRGQENGTGNHILGVDPAGPPRAEIPLQIAAAWHGDLGGHLSGGSSGEIGGGTPRRLLCTTCRAPHGAWARTPLLRTPPAALGFCEECHDRTPENHHAAGLVEGAGNCGSQLPASAYGAAGAIVCSSCRQAHNAGLGRERESDYAPLLISPAGTGEPCERCHPSGNPTCGTDPERQARHFPGEPTLDATYRDNEPPLRVVSWPESGLNSVSGGVGTSRHLRAISGNGQEWEPGEEATCLCIGCHGIQPVTGSGEKGHAHPLMEAAIASLGREPTAPLSETSSGPLAIRPKIDFTPLCHGCHEGTHY